MKKGIYIVFFILACTTTLFSCKGKTYAQELKDEKNLIKDYIKRNGIVVLNKFPADSVSFPEKTYVQTTSGLYYRLVEEGTGRNVEPNDEIITRYYEYTLNSVSDTTDYWNPREFPDPFTFIYMSYSKGPTAFHEAVGYMKKNGAVAELIVPSKIGFSPSVVVPYGYRLKIQFKDNTIPNN